MIDTVIAWCKLPMTYPGKHWHEERKLESNGEWETKYHYNTPLAQMTFRGTLTDGRFTVQASLPNVFFGQNVTLLRYEQVQMAWNKLHTHIAETVQEISLPPIEYWNINRVDWCYSWQVDRVSEYMDVLDRIMIGNRRHVTASYEDRRRGGKTRSIQTNNYWSAQAYDKEAETRNKICKGKIDWNYCNLNAQELDNAARNLLRFEYRAKTRQLEKILGKGNITVAGLDQNLREVGLFWLAEKWNELTSNWQSTSYEDALYSLRVKHGDRAAGDLMDFWMHLTSVGEIKYRQSCPISDSTWSRRKRQLKEAGVGYSNAHSLIRPVIDPFAQH